MEICVRRGETAPSFQGKETTIRDEAAVLNTMKIPKVIRHLIQLAMFCLLAIASFTVAPHLPKPWNIVLFILTVPLAFFVASILSFFVDEIDFWLRRRTYDEIWLMTYEGKQWLASEEGQKWKKG